MISQLTSSFNAGELSARLESRPDLDKYGSGCRTLENFTLMPYGGVNRRPGSVFIAAAKHANKKCRLISFNFSTTTNFVLEFGDQYVRFFSNGVQVQVAGLPYEVASPYLEAELFDIQWVQINDVMYIVHPLHPVHKLSRLSDTNWTLAEVQWTFPAALPQNISATTITPSGTTGTVTLTASAATFTAENVGGYYVIVHKRSSTSEIKTFATNGSSAALRVIGNWAFNTYKTWTATVAVERQQLGSGVWETIRSYAGNSDRNISTTGYETQECSLRVTVSNRTVGTAADVAYIEATDPSVYGVVKITGFTSSTVVTGTVVKDLFAATATTFWAEGAWSDRRGHPRTVVMHEQRLVFGGTANNAQTIWGSAINDFENFRLGVNDDESFEFGIASIETNPINWMISQQALFVGTSGYEYVVQGSNESPLTPSNVNVRPQSHFGSKYESAVLANEVTLFVQRQGRKIREFVYQFESDRYVSPDLTLLADHVTEGTIIQTAFQQQPDAIVWVVTGNGTLAGMTYERSQNVVGWHRHTTQGTYESVACIYGPAGDEVWVAVNRTVNGSTVRYVERFDPGYREDLESEVKTEWVYLDSAIRFSGSPATTFVVPHLTGKTVDVLADGSPVQGKVLAGTTLTLDIAASDVVVGLPYTSEIRTMPLDPGNLQDGSAQGRQFKVHRLTLRIYKSLGGEVEVEPGVWDVLDFRSTSDLMDESPPPFTGDKQLMLSRPYETKGTIAIRQRQPMPFTLLAVVSKFDVYGD
jgi:hypothetical protein